MADVNKGFAFRWSFTLPKLEVYNIILAHFVFKNRTKTLPGKLWLSHSGKKFSVDHNCDTHFRHFFVYKHILSKVCVRSQRLSLPFLKHVSKATSIFWKEGKGIKAWWPRAWTLGTNICICVFNRPFLVKWLSYLIFLNLSFLNRKMGIVKDLLLWNFLKITWDNLCEAFRMLPAQSRHSLLFLLLYL